MSQQKHIKRCLESLSSCDSGNDSKICEALLKIRPYSKKWTGINTIIENEGMEVLIPFLQKTNQRIIDMTISILANCVTQDAARQKICDGNAISHIVWILQYIKCPSITSRVCRAIANLAHNEECAMALHKAATVRLLVHLVKNSSTLPHCICSALRAFKNLANNPSHRKKLVQHGAVAAINGLMPFESDEIASSAVKALSAISLSKSIEFADHMLANDGAAIGELVKIASESADQVPSVKGDVLTILQNLTWQACARPTLGTLGGIEMIVGEIRTILYPHTGVKTSQVLYEGPLPEAALSLISSLCYCCREAINRARLRSLDALPILIYVLNDARWNGVHLFLIGSLLSFVYDEEGLKILHENGIFAALLDKLTEYCILEFNSRGDDDNHMVWDSQGAEEGEGFDRRQSLSYDIPTKFNERPRLKTDDTGRGTSLSRLGNSSVLHEDTPVYSPQWSPINSDSLLDELATFASDCYDDSTKTAQTPVVSHLLPDDVHDDSSSSRDGFDLMFSPALLPATGKQHSGLIKRGCEDSPGSDEKHEVEQADTRMQNPLKKAKLNSQNCEKTNSRSLSTEDVKDKEISGVNTAFQTPPRESFLQAIAGNCSPSFLRFVNETCSDESSVLLHAGSSTAASKQPKRKLSAITATDKAEAVEGISSGLKDVSATLQISVSSPVTELVHKTLSRDRHLDEEIDSATLERPTPTQVVLLILCHYCEVSDSYVVSLCQQDNCIKAIATYLRYCKSLDNKIERIVEKMTSCSECFNHNNTSCLVSTIASVCCTRKEDAASDLDSKETGNREISINWKDLLDTMWRNVALVQSSTYGSNLIDFNLSKWKLPDSRSTTVMTLLLAIWYDETEKLYSVSGHFRRKLYAHTETIAKRKFLLHILQCLSSDDVDSEIFNATSYLFHKLASRVDPNSPGKCYETDANAKSRKGKGYLGNVKKCYYEDLCKSRMPDKELLPDADISSETIPHPSDIGNESEPSIEEKTIPVHSDMLVSKSPMFEAMLLGKYKESNERIVRLMDTSHCCCMFLVHLMYGCDMRVCPYLRKKISEMQINDNTGPTTNTGSVVNQKLELELLKTMDLWLLRFEKVTFLDYFKNFFMENYVKSEILQYENDTSHHLKATEQDTRRDDHSSYFWDYICMHKYTDLVENYTRLFCTSCSFQNNHIVHGIAFVRLCGKFKEHLLFSQIVCERLNSVIEDDLLPKILSSKQE